MRTVNKYLAAH